MNELNEVKVDVDTIETAETTEATPDVKARAARAKGKKTIETAETTEALVTVKAKRPIRTVPNKGLYTKGDILTVTPDEAKKLIASGAAEAV